MATWLRQAPNGYPEILWEERLKGMEAGAEMCTLDPTTIVAQFRGTGNPDEHRAVALPLSRGDDAGARASSRNGRCSPRLICCKTS